MALLKSSRACASEVYSSALCNLNCSYCSIYKIPGLKQINDSIVENVESGKIIQDLKDMFGDKFESLALWGAEPSLTLGSFTKIMPQIFEAFPKLSSIGFSSNFILENHTDKLMKFVESVMPRNVNIKIQVSLDGPPFMTDRNRGGGSTEKILHNLYLFLTKLQAIDFGETKISMHFKPTWDIDNIRDANAYNAYPDLIQQYYDFFDKQMKNIRIFNHRGLTFQEGVSPTLAVPGEYTTADGKEIAKFFTTIDRMGHDIGYVYRLSRLADYGKEFLSKPFMFTCSGGNANFALDSQRRISVCHRTIFSAYDSYTNYTKEQGGMEAKTVDMVKGKFVSRLDDEYEMDRFSYVMSNHHNFVGFRGMTGQAQIMEMALCGQVNPVYKNPEIAMALSLYLHSAFNCPAENIVKTANVHVLPFSLVRAMGNGAFELFVKILTRKNDL